MSLQEGNKSPVEKMTEAVIEASYGELMDIMHEAHLMNKMNKTDNNKFHFIMEYYNFRKVRLFDRIQRASEISNDAFIERHAKGGVL